MKHLRWILFDGITNAINTAARCAEACEGTDDIFIFDDVRKALHDFRDNSPEMRALLNKAVKK